MSGGGPKIADSTGVALTGNGLLIATLVLRRILLREVLSPDETYVGVLLPPSAGGVLVNAALPLLRRIAVNLNYTMHESLLNKCMRNVAFGTSLPAVACWEKFKLNLNAKVLYVEDFRGKSTWFDKAVGLFQSKLPSAILEKHLGITDVSGDDLLTIMFTRAPLAIPRA